RRETEHRVGLTLMAGPAVAGPRNRPPSSEGNRDADAGRRREHRVAPVLLPNVGREPPALPGPLQHPGLEAAPEPELLPESRADRKYPLVRVSGVDLRAAGEADPPPLLRSVAPQRVLRRERQDVAGDLLAAA